MVEKTQSRVDIQEHGVDRDGTKRQNGNCHFPRNSSIEFLNICECVYASNHLAFRENIRTPSGVL